MRNNIKCRSGLPGWRGRLHEVYASQDEFEAASDIYDLASRLGYSSAEEAWDDNPVVEGSVQPSDYRRVM